MPTTFSMATLPLQQCSSALLFDYEDVVIVNKLVSWFVVYRGTITSLQI